MVPSHRRGPHPLSRSPSFPSLSLSLCVSRLMVGQHGQAPLESSSPELAVALAHDGADARLLTVQRALPAALEACSAAAIDHPSLLSPSISCTPDPVSQPRPPCLTDSPGPGSTRSMIMPSRSCAWSPVSALVSWYLTCSSSARFLASSSDTFLQYPTIPITYPQQTHHRR